jgi:beta-galactosidase
LKVTAKKGKVAVSDEITQVYQTEKWGKPVQMVLQKIDRKGDVTTIEVKLYDANKILCLDARNLINFDLAGEGRLLDNLGTSSGSRTVELYNGRAIIRIELKGGESVASVKSEGLPTVLCNLGSSL